MKELIQPLRLLPNIFCNHQRYKTKKTSHGKVFPIPTSPPNYSNYPPDPDSVLFPYPKMELQDCVGYRQAGNPESANSWVTFLTDHLNQKI